VDQVIRNAGPAILGRGVVQLSAWVDVFLASWLFAGAIAALGYAQTLYVLPVSLFGMAVAAAELPEMARQRANATAALTERLNAGLRQIALFVVPSTVGYLLMGDVIVAALYQTGEFGPADTLLVALVLGGYTIGLIASTATRLFASALYAMNDTRTPARIAFVRVILAAAIGIGLMLWLEGYAVSGPPLRLARAASDAEGVLHLGVVGLAVAAGIAAWVEWYLLRRAVRERIGDARVGSSTLLRLVGAAVVAGVVARGIHYVLPPLHPALAAALALAPFGVIYFGLASVLGVEDAGRAVRRIGRRFGLRS
jgi:putative peptidoglycan lipid II flippase